MKKLLLATAALCCWSFFGVAAPAPEKKDEVGPVEIDFAPLPEEAPGDNLLDYSIKLVIRCADGSSYKQTFTVKGKIFSVGALRDTVNNDLAIDGWTVKKVGDKKLVVEGYKESQVKTLEVSAEKLTKESIPTTKRVKLEKEKKDDDKKD